jgi:hypothetical protein
VPDQGFAADLESLRLNAGLGLRGLGLRALVRASGIPRSTSVTHWPGAGPLNCCGTTR